jgi:hypothetical protein
MNIYSESLTAQIEMEKKPEVKKKADTERRRESEKSIEVNFMLLLMRKYPDKAKEAARKLTPQTI